MFKQLWGSLGSAVAGACCLGFAPVLAGLSAVGAGFLINDLILVPLFVLALAFTTWSLLRARRQHSRNGPLILGAASAVVAFVALWVLTPLAYLALAALVGASAWDIVLVRHPQPGAAGSGATGTSP